MRRPRRGTRRVTPVENERARVRIGRRSPRPELHDPIDANEKRIPGKLPRHPLHNVRLTASRLESRVQTVSRVKPSRTRSTASVHNNNTPTIIRVSPATTGDDVDGRLHGYFTSGSFERRLFVLFSVNINKRTPSARRVCATTPDGEPIPALCPVGAHITRFFVCIDVSNITASYVCAHPSAG